MYVVQSVCCDCVCDVVVDLENCILTGRFLTKFSVVGLVVIQFLNFQDQNLSPINLVITFLDLDEMMLSCF